jgi:hypothetical protein
MRSPSPIWIGNPEESVGELAFEVSQPASTIYYWEGPAKTARTQIGREVAHELGRHRTQLEESASGNLGRSILAACRIGARGFDPTSHEGLRAPPAHPLRAREGRRFDQLPGGLSSASAPCAAIQRWAYIPPDIGNGGANLQEPGETRALESFIRLGKLSMLPEDDAGVALDLVL